uniref:Uncharacterized protein n=1 Tax=Meloidogyne enterolobii TaxID=390850 RepID=A0A6V7V694_MELEN|nr:unnamed protein product [Meloidogyne enterolobii]
MRENQKKLFYPSQSLPFRLTPTIFYFSLLFHRSLGVYILKSQKSRDQDQDFTPRPRPRPEKTQEKS